MVARRVGFWVVAYVVRTWVVGGRVGVWVVSVCVVAGKVVVGRHPYWGPATKFGSILRLQSVDEQLQIWH